MAIDSIIPVICGFAYGTCSVVVGQPLETIKTQLQTSKKSTSLQVAKSIFEREGLRGFYRGGLPLLLGGSLIRSAQFGVHENMLIFLQKCESFQAVVPKKFFGVLDSNTLIAGFCGGIGRGLIEGPFEYVKVRRQVYGQWKFKEIFEGYGATLFRNALLFSAFVTYLDISKQLVPGGLSPFLSGAICSSLAWLTVWPLDVVKSRVQSGLYSNVSYMNILMDIARNDKSQLFRGIGPGLFRSSLANGASMYVYKQLEKHLINL
jgi:solute carrier family 25 carnitine/acylcarnitine transporter 20/29